MKLKLQDQENLRDIYRQNKLFLLEPALLAIFLILVPFIFLFKYDLLSEFKLLIYLLFAVVFIIFFRKFILWYESRYIITNKRLLIYKQKGLFNKSVIDTPLDRVLNVSYKTKGVISSIFNFGDVEVQVIGLMDPVILKNITRPEQVKDYLWELHNRVVPGGIKYDAEMVTKRSSNSDRN